MAVQSNDTDLKDFYVWLKDDTCLPDTVSRSSFQANRLLSLQTRNSAAYKGVMALLLQDELKDFATGGKMSIATYTLEDTDIHHIFPASYCEKTNLPRSKWNSVVNKTMIYASTNRSIGGVAPSRYIEKLGSRQSLQTIKEAIETHKIEFNLLNNDNFDYFIVSRAIALLDMIEKAIGKSVASRESQETIDAFGCKLVQKPLE